MNEIPTESSEDSDIVKGTLSNSTGRGKRSQFTVQQVKEIQAVRN